MSWGMSSPPWTSVAPTTTNRPPGAVGAAGAAAPPGGVVGAVGGPPAIGQPGGPVVDAVGSETDEVRVLVHLLARHVDRAVGRDGDAPAEVDVAGVPARHAGAVGKGHVD